MSQPPETLSPLPSGLTPPPPAGPPGYSWSQSWIKAVTERSVTTFEQIASDAAASSNSRAYNWLFIAGIIAGVINFLGGFIFPKTLPFPGADSRIVQGSPSLLGLLCGVPIAVLIGILILVVIVGVTQIIAGLLGGTGTFSKLMYTTAAINAPITILSSVFGLVPIVACLNLPLVLYGLVLHVMAVKAVNQFGWGPAIISSLVIWIFLLVLVAVVIIVILALLGPSIGNIFSNTVRSL